MSPSQLNKLKSRIKKDTKVSSNVVGDSNDENNFLHKLLLTNAQVSGLLKDFSDYYSANIKLSKTQLYKIERSDGFLGALLGPLQMAGLPLIGNVLEQLSKNVLIQLGLIASATDTPIHKKMFGSGKTVLIISNEEMNDLMKIVKSHEEPGLVIKGV